jgi:hypothetical protein
MKTVHRSLLTVSLFTVAAADMPAQGLLTPPAGPPAPLFKTLQQIEPRTEINATNTPGDAQSLFRITAPGSYYLSGNITGVSGKAGIVIASNDVTLDLNGFELLGVAGSLTGIRTETTAIRGVAIRNGSVRMWGSNGVDTVVVRGPLLDHLHVADNGGSGITHAGGVVTHCTAVRNGANGFTSSQLSSGNGDSTRSAVFEGCAASANVAAGFTVNGIARHCSATHNGTAGFNIFSGSLVGCNSSSNAIGIVAGSAVVVRDNTVFFNTTAGIQLGATTNSVLIQGNTVRGPGPIGLDIDGPGNVITANDVSDCTDNYDIAGGNQVELLISQIPENIEVPAKITLVGDLTGVSGSAGLTVTSDGVSIDLNGHALIGVAGSLDGISVPAAVSQVSVRNGTVRNWGGDGIDSDFATGGSFTDLELSANTESGLEGGDDVIVQRVISRENGQLGIFVQTNSRVLDCVAATNSSSGISLGDGSTVQHCTAQGNAASGIVVSDNSLVLENTCDLHDDAGQAGILVNADRNRIEGNHVTRGNVGLILGAGANFNFVVRNTASGNSTNYVNSGANNDIGPIGTAATATSPWANLQN